MWICRTADGGRLMTIPYDGKVERKWRKIDSS